MLETTYGQLSGRALKQEYKAGEFEFNGIDTMATWEIIVNVFLIIVILVATIAITLDYREHKNDESISPEDLKALRRSHFKFALLVAAWLLYVHVGRFFNW